jgi:DNA-binding MarR family transcriptional regulator
MAALNHAQKTLLRQLSEGRVPQTEVRLASTSWWYGEISVTRQMNQLRKKGFIRCWRDTARNQRMEITDEGYAEIARW